jgi:shikimate kinase
MGDILRERAHLYRQSAHHEVNAMQTPEQVVDQILQSLSLARAS